MCVVSYITLAESSVAEGLGCGVWLQPGACAAPDKARLRVRAWMEGKSLWDQSRIR